MRPRSELAVEEVDRVVDVDGVGRGERDRLLGALVHLQLQRLVVEREGGGHGPEDGRCRVSRAGDLRVGAGLPDLGAVNLYLIEQAHDVGEVAHVDLQLDDGHATPPRPS
jgi:hypothetical protein